MYSLLERYKKSKINFFVNLSLAVQIYKCNCIKSLYSWWTYILVLFASR